MNARASTATGDGLTAAQSGRPALLVVSAADRFGNSVAAPPERPGQPGFSAVITGSKKVPRHLRLRTQKRLFSSKQKRAL